MPHTRNSKERVSRLSDLRLTSAGGYAQRTLPIPKATSGRSTSPLKQSQRGKRNRSVALFGHHSDISRSPRKETMTKREQKLLRVGAAAHELGLHPITVRRWINAGRIQAVPMGREVRVPRGSGRTPSGQNRWAITRPLWQGERTWAKGGSRYPDRTAASLGGSGTERRRHAGAL